MIRLVASSLFVTMLAPCTATLAQASGTPVHVALGFGVDTASTPEREIFKLWHLYLSSRPDSVRRTALWSQAEQAKWPHFDLLRSFVYQGFTNYTVVDLLPAVGLDSTYLIRTLVAAVSDSIRRTVRPLALYRVYAVREEGRWTLANALPRLTRDWNRETFGRVTFVFPRSRRFARSRAETAAAFVDSLARAFDVVPPSNIEYYFTNDLRETLRAVGLEFFPLGADTLGGRANVFNRLVFIGSSSKGEEYRHELAHVVLAPFLAERKSHGLLQEGLMTWTGGSAGLDFKALMPALKRYLDKHPDLSLESIMTKPPMRQGSLDVAYDGLAVLCEMVYSVGGLVAIRTLFGAGSEPRSVLAAAARLLRTPAADLDSLWRDRVAALSR